MGSRFKEWVMPEFDEKGMTKWNWMCQHPENLKIGKGADIGAFSYINALHGVEIKEDAQIGSHAAIYSVSTIDGKKGKVSIGRNARIGSHSIIMPGVTIGDNAIVGAFSMVNRNIPDNYLAYGVPVRLIRQLKNDEFQEGDDL
jgi:acetyltransferase-like isoleucine patch superfamily enzyme